MELLKERLAFTHSVYTLDCSNSDVSNMLLNLYAYQTVHTSRPNEKKLSLLNSRKVKQVPRSLLGNQVFLFF